MIKDGVIKCVMGEGMPTYKNPFEKGRLVISFTVKFPEDNWIDPSEISKLEQYLPPRQECIIPDDAEACELSKVEPNQQRQRYSRSAYEEDDDDEHGGNGPRVQCANQ